ncbi:MAG: hypothetical protein WC346_05180 [Methanogenium sp.]|jgi:hypothetical protein
MASKLDKIRNEINGIVLRVGFEKSTRGDLYHGYGPNGRHLVVRTSGNNFKLSVKHPEFELPIKSIPMSKLKIELLEKYLIDQLKL